MRNARVVHSILKRTKAERLSAVSTLGLIVMMFFYLLMTLWSSNQLVDHTEVIAAHPFEVVASAGDLRTNIAEMRIRTERLTMHNSVKDIALVRDALNELYEAAEERVDYIGSLYLGAQEDVDALRALMARLRTAQDACLEFAAQSESSLSQIEEYETEYLHPLYSEATETLDHMVESAQTKKVQYGEMTERLRTNTLIGSLILVMPIIGALLLSQRALRKQREELTLRSQLFDALSANIDDAFIIRDAKSEEIYYTALNMERVLGFRVEKLDDVYRGFRREDAAEIRAAVRGGEFVSPLVREIEHTRPNGDKRWMSIRIYRALGMETTQVISVLSDCTEELKSRQALQDALLSAERANSAKSDFLSRMSHEIRTPLNAIIGMTTIAAASANAPQKVADCLAKINFSSKHLLMLINDVLDMSKIESDKMALQTESFDLSQLVNGFTSTMYAQAQAKGVMFDTRVEGFEGQTQYLGDPLRLNQILLNLGSNAVKFTPPGGSITLIVTRLAKERTADTLRFLLRDTGIGMDAEALGRIFKPFEQADASIAGRYGGTGLGMSITQNLVNLMSGRIDIQSEPDAGTTCIVDLPLPRDEDVAPPPDYAELGLRALVADDEPGMCRETASMLQNIRIDAECVYTGADAVTRVVEAFQSGSCFDFCLIDWKMPDFNGVEATRRIRAAVGAELPIIMISAYDCSAFEDEARAAGANAFLAKPLYRSSVYEAIKAALGAHPQAARQASHDTDTLRGRRLLVAEDNELNREIVVELLAMYGVVTECAVNGSEALQKFENASPGYFDAILMDVQMPVMDGYEATRRIRMSGRPDAAAVPIIATTANAFSDDISLAFADV